jgi:carbon-monoxide dehydrogenase medium subunit/6-hydroxypseudooxynicotine dehydrogenase subunit alpha
MKPPPFEYQRPSTVEEALQMLDEPALEVKPLAGGQSLVPMLNFRLARPDRLVDVNRLGELAYVRRAGGTLRIGALTRQRAIERSPVVAAHFPLLRQAVEWVAHAQIRNRGTVGGSIAHADPAAELPVALVALDAVVHVRSVRGARSLAASELFVTHLTTALEPDELLVEIEIPPVPARTGTAFTEFARRHGDYGLGGAAVSVTLDGDGRVERAAIALLSAGPVPVRATEAEALLAGRAPDAAAAREAAAAAVAGIEPTGDIHGSAAYRRGLIETLVERGIVAAGKEAQ